MKKENNELMEEFYQKIKGDYPELSFDKVRTICSAPWKFLKDKISSGTLEDIRLKYFGTFRVFPGRVKECQKKNKERLEKGTLSEKNYNYYETIYNNYLERNELL